MTEQDPRNPTASVTGAEVAAALASTKPASVSKDEWDHPPRLYITWSGWRRPKPSSWLYRGNVLLPLPPGDDAAHRRFCADPTILVTWHLSPDDPVYDDKGGVWFPKEDEEGRQPLTRLLAEGPAFVAPREAFEALVAALGIARPAWLRTTTEQSDPGEPPAAS